MRIKLSFYDGQDQGKPCWAVDQRRIDNSGLSQLVRLMKRLKKDFKKNNIVYTPR